MSKSQRTGDNNQHRDDVSSFEPRKIKRERNDSFETHDISLINSNIEPDNQQQQQQQLRLGAGSKSSNGYHIGDLLQDVITVKSVTNNHGNNPAQNDEIRRMIEDSLSDESKHKVQDLFLRVEQLTTEEKLLLYLKLPVSLTNLGSTTDPLRQPLNPLGNRYEIHQTIMWIRTHLVEDPDVSLPKQEVYDEYNHFCTQNSMKPLSTADFGKVMKQVYPRVKPRRLGTRGNSRYCYAGMRKRVNLSTPTLPEISGPIEEDEFDEPITEKMLGAASIIIREWAESVLGLKFPSLCSLSRHLVEHLCVDTMSLSAVCILSASAIDIKPATPKIPETPPSLSTTPVGGKSGKLREAQIQLQKKLQQREHIRDQVQNQQGKDKTDVIIYSGNQGKVTGIVKIKKTRNQVSSQSPQTIITQNTLLKSSSSSSSSLSTTPTTTNTTTIKSRKIQKSISQVSPQLNCDTMTRNNGSSTKNNDLITKEDKLPVKNSRKRVSLDLSINSIDTSPEKQAKLNDDNNKIIKNEVIGFKKISLVPSCTLKSKLELEKLKINNNKNKLINGTNKVIQVVDDNNTELLTKEEIKKICENSNILERNDKLCSIDADALDDYLNGGNNSQEPEEELLQYFQQSNSSSSDAETIINQNILLDDNNESRLDKVSQIRLILEQNLKDTTSLRSTIEPSTSSLLSTITTTPTITTTTTTTTTTSSSSSSSSALSLSKNPVPIEKTDIIIEKNKIILPKILNHHTTNTTNSRRRVSFETNVIDNSQELNSSLTINTVPQSPNTRRRGFNFTPISPGPHSPINGRTASSSKPGSENASPFVSPRNTPVPRSRSNMAGICRTRGQKHLARSISCSVPNTGRIDNNNFVVPVATTTSSSNSLISQCPLTTNNNNTKSTTIDGQIINRSTINNTICPINETDKKSITCETFLSSDINSEKQLVINYPSQENLQEIKNNYRRINQPADEEIIELFNGVKPFINEQYYRSQSVPLHRMVNPTLMSSPILSTQSYLSSFQSPNFNPSSGSSIAPTPVPSEFNDFGSTYLLDEYDANLIDDDQNISKILNLLGAEDGKDLNILNDRNDENLILDTIPNSNLNLNDTMLGDQTVGDSINKIIIQSRSYPNTPLPPVASSYPPAFTEDSNGSRSYPSTPLHTIQPQDVYRESNEPMLSSPTLNSLNLRSDTGNPGSQESVCRNVSDLLEPNFLVDPDNDTDDLNTLSNFDGLQDVDTLTPLFNEVSDANR